MKRVAKPAKKKAEKKKVCIRLDEDVIAWYKRKGPGYQTRINALLRRAMDPARASGSAGPALVD